MNSSAPAQLVHWHFVIWKKVAEIAEEHQPEYLRMAQAERAANFAKGEAAVLTSLMKEKIRQVAALEQVCL